MDDFQPTPTQQELISLVEGSHLVQAPPGTGKTEVLTRRVISLLESNPGQTFRVLGLTFTTKAAENLRERVLAGVSANAGDRITATTFHGFCLSALQHYGHLVAFPSDTTVYENDDDRMDVLSRAAKEEAIDVEQKDLRSLLVQVGAAKRALTPPELVEDADFGIIYAAYNNVLRRFHACDFDDLLWSAWKLFTTVPKAALHYRRLFRFIVIDEAQDTSRAQYEILKALCGDEHRNVMMVADSDQFIYRFTGASDKWLDAFLQDFGAQRHQLFENFRCASAIIALSERLKVFPRGQPHPVGVLASHPPPGSVLAKSYQDEAAEACGVADWVQSLLAQGLDRQALHPTESGRITAEDICVLGRNRYVLQPTLTELRRRGIPALFRAGRKGLLETEHAELVVHGLKLLQNPLDAVTRERIGATWLRSTSPAVPSDLPGLFRAVALAAPDTARISEVFVNAAKPFDLTDLVRSLLEALSTAAEATNRDANWRFMAGADLKTLEERWQQYIRPRAPETRSLGGFLGEVALAGQSVIDGPGVRILTIHTAKGLEFKAVSLIGMNEGVLPDYRALQRSSDVDDEKRLAYVAVTRASRVLLVTRPRSRVMPWGEAQWQRPSRFIADMQLSTLDV